MTVFELLAEMHDKIETPRNVLLTNKVMVDRDEFMELISSIHEALPEDLTEAMWINKNKDTIISEAEADAKKIVANANKLAADLVEEHIITKNAKERAAQITNESEAYCRDLKIKTFEYVDKMLFNMGEQLDGIYVSKFRDMVNSIEQTFAQANETINVNRQEVISLAETTVREGKKLD
ncbi:MAG: hypothetical protein PUG43_00930 [Clostridiales bacterium]|nr:hypothetical protein [Clostridiales bacterium]MDD7347099.1 hypothetical protein [Clostridiales bacterium]MDY4060585.1 hypothetical protein [Anaerovoracaceae bacterium]